MIARACNPSTREAEAGRSGLQGHPWLHGEFESTGDLESTNQQNNAASQNTVFLTGGLCRSPACYPGLPGSAHQAASAYWLRSAEM